MEKSEIFLLDTNICIYVINIKPPDVLQKFREKKSGTIAVSSITAGELAYGVLKSGSERNRRALELLLAPIEILPFGPSAIWHYGRIRVTLERKGQPIGAMDTLIAAHALSLGATLVTNNTREFCRVEELLLENWV